MMKKVLITIMSLVALVSCEYIPDYKFSASIPSDLLAASYAYMVEGSRDEARFILTLSPSGTFSFSTYDSDYRLLPSSGVYSASYSSYTVLAASGVLHFSNMEQGTSVDASFSWQTDAVYDEPTLTIDIGRGRYTLRYAGEAGNI